MNKLAIIVGHNAQAQGAVRKDTGETEYSWNGRLAIMTRDLASDYGIDARIFRRQPVGSYSEQIREVYRLTDEWGAEAALELHFNGDDGDASGTEVLSSGTSQSLRFSGLLQEEMVETLGLRDRGVKTVRGKERGAQSLISGRAPAALVEPFFGSSRIGTAATDTPEEMLDLAHAYLRAASQFLGSLPRKDLAGSRTIRAIGRQRAGQATVAASLTSAVVLEAVRETQTALDMVPSMGPFAEALPYISAGLALIALAATFHTSLQSAKIKAAREDDHERGLR